MCDKKFAMKTLTDVSDYTDLVAKVSDYFEEAIEGVEKVEVCKLNRWGSRVLEGCIKSMLYERTAISKKPDETVAHDLGQLSDEGELSTFCSSTAVGGGSWQ